MNRILKWFHVYRMALLDQKLNTEQYDVKNPHTYIEYEGDIYGGRSTNGKR